MSVQREYEYTTASIAIESDLSWQDPERIEFSPPDLGAPRMHVTDWSDALASSDPFAEAEAPSL